LIGKLRQIFSLGTLKGKQKRIKAELTGDGVGKADGDLDGFGLGFFDGEDVAGAVVAGEDVAGAIVTGALVGLLVITVKLEVMFGSIVAVMRSPDLF
jgi:hypothetical protein